MDLRPMARGALVTVLAAVLGAIALLLAGCAAPATTSVLRFVSPDPAGSAAGVYRLVPGDDPTLTQTGGGTYLSWDGPSGAGTGPPRMVLARIDPRTGTVEATNTFSAGLLGTPLVAGGSLWITDSAPLGELLLRLDPGTLMVTGELSLGAARYPGLAHLAYAGGWLWADGGGRLLRVSPSGDDLTATIALRGASSSSVAASPDGSVLVVTEQGPAGAVQRRDPRTGALLAASPVPGATGAAAVVDGFTSSGVWVTAVAGTSARAEQLSLRSMKPVGTRSVSGPADLRVRVAHGVLWVAGGPGRGYCADAGTGRPLAALPVPGHGQLLAVGDGGLYYAEPGSHGTGTRIAPAPVPAGCG
jgi:hypothetical protein